MQPYGDYEVLAHHEFPDCSLRMLRMAPGQEVTSHYHTASAQSYLALEGSVEVQVGDIFRRLDPGDAARVPVGTVHSIRPVGGTAVVLSVSVPPLRVDDHIDAASARPVAPRTWE